MTSYSCEHQLSNNSIIENSEQNTFLLKEKMKKLEEQIQSLQKLKIQNQLSGKSNKFSIKLLKSSQQSSKVEQNQNAKTVLEIQPLNIKNSKVNSLIKQIRTGNANLMNKKPSLRKTINLKPQQQSIQDLKQKLQKIQDSVPKKKKKAGVNVYEIKGIKHELNSNIFNVTIAQIMTEEHQKYQMLKQIKNLKIKLGQFEKKQLKNEQIKSYRDNTFEQQSLDIKDQNPSTGKIYSRSRRLALQYPSQSFRIRNSANETTDQPKNYVQLRKNLNPQTWNPEMTLTRTLKSTQFKQNQTRNHKNSCQIQIQNNSFQNQENTEQIKKKPILQFLKNKNIHKKLNSNYLNLQKTEPSTMIELIPELKIDKMKKHPKVLPNLISNFRQYIKSKMLLVALPPQPTQFDAQSQLQSLGRIIFQLFGIQVDKELQDTKKQYKVTKYKNCVLFRINQQINVVWYYDGKFYFGGWKVNLIGDGKKQGFGLEMIPNSHVYQGHFINNKRQGFGIMYYIYKASVDKNTIYEGFWKQGLKQGRGYQAEDDLEYLGDFRQSLQTGTCKIKTANTYYEGEIRQSIKEGIGHEILKNGDQYWGSFKQNMFHGLGQYKWKNGAYFYGDFCEGKRKGQGVWISNLNTTNYDLYKGSYEENKKSGFGVYQWANSTCYEGYFKNDLRHDEGMMKYSNGKTAKFIWKEGIKTSKLYSKEQQNYRTRGSLNKVSAQNQINSEFYQKNNSKFQTNFLKQTLQELNSNKDLKLYRKSESL